MKRYVIQYLAYPSWDNKWLNCPSQEYDTLPEANAAYNALPIKADHRIAETYVQVRYKAVKV